MFTEWKVEPDLHGEGYYIVDVTGKKICYVYNKSSSSIATLISKLPELIKALKSQIQATNYITDITKEFINSTNLDINNSR